MHDDVSAILPLNHGNRRRKQQTNVGEHQPRVCRPRSQWQNHDFLCSHPLRRPDYDHLLPQLRQMVIPPSKPSHSPPDSCSPPFSLRLLLSPLDPTVLEKIPIFVYSSETHQLPLEECSVCLSEFEEDDEGRLLPKCGHAFHVDCIDTWFRSSSTCPLCRAPVQPEFTEQAAPVKPVEDIETGSSSSSSSSPSPLRFPMEACEREPIDLVGLTVEIPAEFEGSVNRVLSLKRLWSI
ncbi:hypothetical protein Bca4012_034726 [Brassica carinata]